MLTFTFSSLIRRIAFGCCVLALPSLAVAQQTGGTSGTGATGGPAATEAAAADAGQQLTSQNLFSTTEAGAGTGALGSNQGRFATNQFQDAPTATGTGANTGQSGQTTTNRFGGNQNTRRGNTQRGNIQNRFGGNARSRQTIRPALRLGFVPPQRPSADVTRSVERRFNTLSARTSRLADTVPAFRGVTIKVGDAGKVTLSGEVATSQAARLAANILRMEAGVRSVQNDLTVAAK